MKRYTNGATIYTALFVLAITSFLVTIINERRQAQTNIIATSNFNITNATKIAYLGAEMAISEMNTNSDASTDYATQVTNDEYIIENLAVNNGTLSVKFAGDLANGPMQIISTGTYKKTSRTITLTLYKENSRRMLLIEPTIDTEYPDRRASFINLGWEVTTTLESNITSTNDLILQKDWNMVYLPSSISLNIDTLSDLNLPLTSEKITGTNNLGTLQNSISPIQTLTSSLYALPTSQTQTPVVSYSFATSNFNFAYLNNTDIVPSAIKEFTDDNFNATDKGNRTVIYTLPKNGIRNDTTASPESRIILNIQPSLTSSWSSINATGLGIIDNLLNISCNTTICYRFRISNIEID